MKMSEDKRRKRRERKNDKKSTKREWKGSDTEKRGKRERGIGIRGEKEREKVRRKHVHREEIGDRKIREKLEIAIINEDFFKRS